MAQGFSEREGTIQGAFDLEGVKTGADLRRVLEVALLDTLEQKNSVARTRALAYVVSVLGRLKETTEFEARLQALEASGRGAGPEARPQPLRARLYLQHPVGAGRSCRGPRRRRTPMRPRKSRLDARLDAVAAGMPGPQRVGALLAGLLEAESDGRAVVTSLGQGLSPAEWAAHRRTCERADQLRATTHAYFSQVEALVTCLYLVAGWHRTVELSAALADQLETALDRRDGRRRPRGQGHRELERKVRAVADDLRGLAVTEEATSESDRPVPTMEDVLRDRLGDAHHLLRALEIEAAAFAAELGADPRGPGLHAVANDQRTVLAACIETIDLDPPVILTEPSDEYVAAIAARCRPAEDAEADSW